MKFKELNYGDIFLLSNYSAGVYMKIHNMLRDDNINNQVNTAILFGLWRGDFTRLSDNQEVLLLDRK